MSKTGAISRDHAGVAADLIRQYGTVEQAALDGHARTAVATLAAAAAISGS